MDYVDFRVRIERGQDGLRVRASSPAAGEAAARFEFPEVAAQAARLAEELERAVNAARGSGATARQVSVGSERAALDPSSAALGERLFSALLPEGVRERFFQALGHAAARLRQEWRASRSRRRRSSRAPAAAVVVVDLWKAQTVRVRPRRNSG
jgi:hypothetical protein